MSEINQQALLAIGPLDGRYRKDVEALSGHFSEAALWRYRVRVEVEYLLFLARAPRSKASMGSWPELCAIYIANLASMMQWQSQPGIVKLTTM